MEPYQKCPIAAKNAYGTKFLQMWFLPWQKCPHVPCDRLCSSQLVNGTLTNVFNNEYFLAPNEKEKEVYSDGFDTKLLIL